MSEKRSADDIGVILGYLNEHVDRLHLERKTWEALEHDALANNCSLHIKVLTAHIIDLQNELSERQEAGS